MGDIILGWPINKECIGINMAIITPKIPPHDWRSYYEVYLTNMDDQTRQMWPRWYSFDFDYINQVQSVLLGIWENRNFWSWLKENVFCK